MADAETSAGGLYKLWIRLTRILDVQAKHAKLIDAQAAEITSLREAVLILQAREEVLLAKAELAAARAVSAALSDQGRRIGHLETKAVKRTGK